MLHLMTHGKSNAKMAKSYGKGYDLYGLSLTPSDLSGFGNTCTHASASCRMTCVMIRAGRHRTASVRAAQDRRTKLLFENRKAFLYLLNEDAETITQKAKGKKDRPAVRLNLGSDILYERLSPSLFDFPVCYYDYSKVPSRFNRKTLPNNYHLTYSWSEDTDPKFAERILQQDDGWNVAVVFSTPYPHGTLPTTFTIRGKEYPVIDGDTHDLRLPEYDGTQGTIIGLRGKGGAANVLKGIEGGFIQHVDP